MKSIVRSPSILVALCLVALITASARARIDEEAVMGCWLFEEGRGDTVEDSSGNERNAEFTGAHKWVDGKYDNAVEVAGTQVIVPGTEETFQLESYSLLAWIKAEHTGNFQGLIHKEQGGVSGRTFLMYLGTDGVPSGSMSQGGTNSDFKAKTQVTDEEWHHIALTFDAESKIATIYVNGIMEGTKNYPEERPQHNEVVKFNKTNFSGAIDEVLITNTVMEEEDIQEAMKGLKEFVSASAVKPSGKIALTWSAIKTEW